MLLHRLGLPKGSWKRRDKPKRSERTTDRLVALYTAAGVEFTNGDAPGVRLRRKDQGGVIPGDKLTAENDT